MKALYKTGLLVMSAVIAILIIGATHNSTATDDAEDVEREFMAHVAAARAGDVDGYLKRHHPQMTTFILGEGILKEYGSRDEQRAGAQAAIDSGLFDMIEARDIHIKTFGGDAAYLTFYLVMTSPDGATMTTRRSEMWVKEGGQWMEAHGHWSEM